MGVAAPPPPQRDEPPPGVWPPPPPRRSEEAPLPDASPEEAFAQWWQQAVEDVAIVSVAGWKELLPAEAALVGICTGSAVPLTGDEARPGGGVVDSLLGTPLAASRDGASSSALSLAMVAPTLGAARLRGLDPRASEAAQARMHRLVHTLAAPATSVASAWLGVGSLRAWVKDAEGIRSSGLPWWALDIPAIAAVLRSMAISFAAEREAAAEASRAATQAAEATAGSSRARDAAKCPPYEPQIERPDAPSSARSSG